MKIRYFAIVTVACLVAGCPKSPSDKATQRAADRAAARMNKLMASAVSGQTLTQDHKDRIKVIDAQTDWKGGRTPDATGTLKTKFGSIVTWKSWGPVAEDLQPAYQNGLPHNPSRRKRFPRVYECTIDKSGQLKNETHFDLYDIGLQRHIDYTLVQVVSGGVVTFAERTDPKPAVACGGTYKADDWVWVHGGWYNTNAYPTNPNNPNYTGVWDTGDGDYVTKGVTLTFTDSKVVLRVYRGVEPGLPDESEGSPPPIDPGNNNNEAN